jgi:hypothetical protein
MGGDYGINRLEHRRALRQIQFPSLRTCQHAECGIQVISHQTLLVLNFSLWLAQTAEQLLSFEIVDSKAQPEE